MLFSFYDRLFRPRLPVVLGGANNIIRERALRIVVEVSWFFSYLFRNTRMSSGSLHGQISAKTRLIKNSVVL